MATVYRIYPMVFDRTKWAAVLNVAAAGDQKGLAYLLGIDPSTLSGWINDRYSPNFQHPSMTFFLNVCNMLDLNPQEFFCLDESEKNSDAR